MAAREGYHSPTGRGADHLDPVPGAAARDEDLQARVNKLTLARVRHLAATPYDRERYPEAPGDVHEERRALASLVQEALSRALALSSAKGLGPRSKASERQLEERILRRILQRLRERAARL